MIPHQPHDPQPAAFAVSTIFQSWRPLKVGAISALARGGPSRRFSHAEIAGSSCALAAQGGKDPAQDRRADESDNEHDTRSRSLVVKQMGRSDT